MSDSKKPTNTSFLNQPGILSREYTPSSAQFAKIRTWITVLIVLIIALLVFYGFQVISVLNTDTADSTNMGAVVFAVILTGAVIPFKLAGIVAIIPFIMGLSAAKKLSWKIQPVEKLQLFTLGLLSVLGITFLPNLPDYIGTLF